MARRNLARLTTALLMVGLTCQGSPAWAQVEGVESRVDFNDPVIEQGIANIPDPETRAIAEALHDQCQQDRQMADSITQEARALVEAEGTAKDMVEQTIKAIQAEGDAKAQGVVTELTKLSTALDQGTLVDVEGDLQSLAQRLGELDSFKAMTAGEMAKAREFWEMGTSDPLDHVMKEHFEHKMTEMMGQGETLSPDAMRELGEQMFAAGINPREVFLAGGEFGGPGEMPNLEQMEAMVASGQMSPEQLEMAKEYMQGGFEHMGPGGFEHMGPGGMEMQGMSPMEAFEQMAGTMGEYATPEQMEHYREMAETYQKEFENQNYDNTQFQQFENFQPSPGGEVLMATHDHDVDGIPDEYHYDTNGDNVPDHAHPTPH